MDTRGQRAAVDFAQRLISDAREHVARRLGRTHAAQAPGDPAQSLRAILFSLTGSLPPERLEALPSGQLRRYAGMLKGALARERGKARAGHHGYDVNRHIALHQAARRLAALIAEGGEGTPGSKTAA